MIGPRLIDLGNPVADHPLNRGLVGWWLCLPHSMGGSRFFDIAGRNHGTLTNSPTWQPIGCPGGYGSLKFDGSDDQVSVGSIPVFDSAGAFTVSLWAKRTGSVIAGARLIEKGANTEWCLYWASGSSIELLMFGSGSGGIITGLSQDVWYHVVATRPSGTGSQLCSLYLNGVLFASSSKGAASGVGSFIIGRYGGGGSYTHNGLLDDIRLWSRVLTADEVRVLYHDSRLGHPDTLRRYTPRAWYFPYATSGGSSSIVPIVMHQTRQRRIG